jgi:hypothetical protein
MIAGSDGLVDIGSLSRKLGVLYQSFRFVPFLVRCFLMSIAAQSLLPFGFSWECLPSLFHGDHKSHGPLAKRSSLTRHRSAWRALKIAHQDGTDAESGCRLRGKGNIGARMLLDRIKG